MSNDIPASEDTRPLVLAYNALQVFLLDPLIRAYLDEHDPMSVEQAREAVVVLELLQDLITDEQIDPSWLIRNLRQCQPKTTDATRRVYSGGHVVWYDDYTEADEVEDAAKGE